MDDIAPPARSQLPPQAAAASSRAIQAAIKESQPKTLPSSIPTTASSPPPSLSPFSTSPATSSATPVRNDSQTPSDPPASSDTADRPPVGPEDSKINDLITVFNSQTQFNVKHPLYSNWTLWFDNASNASKTDKAKNWDDLIQQVMQVESVEEFWGLYHNIVPPSMTPVGANYYLFKEGIRPAWEDEANQNGGRWCIQLARDKSKDVIDKLWLYTMLAAIGETFETPYSSSGKEPSEMTFTNEVTGVLVSSRKMFFRICVWTRSADSKPVAENVGRHFKYGVLGAKEPPNGVKKAPHVCADNFRGVQTDCEFQSHADSQKRKRCGWTV